MKSKITTPQIKNEIRKSGLNPANFFIYNDGCTIGISANGIDRTLQEEAQIRSNANLRIEVLERQDQAEKRMRELIEKIGSHFEYSLSYSGTRISGMNIKR